ncbi:hypothetical protein BpHYR1_010676, partial [Brachionus plicatilis]
VSADIRLSCEHGGHTHLFKDIKKIFFNLNRNVLIYCEERTSRDELNKQMKACLRKSLSALTKIVLFTTSVVSRLKI